MKLVQALQWVIAHQDLVFMFLGEFFTASLALLAACRPLIKLFANLADLTANTWDNKAVKAVSDFFDLLAASLDRLRRYLPAPRFGLPTTLQPITTKESRAAAATDVMLAAAPSIPPLESKRPPPPQVIDVLPAPVIIRDDSELQRQTIPSEEPKP